MTVLDPSSDLGKLRLRCGDWQDLVWLPDAVYVQTLSDNAGNLPKAAKICATYILGMLAFKVHRKIGLQMEVWNDAQFHQYKEFLLLTVTNPAFMDISPIPYSASGTALNPLLQFASDWNRNYYTGSQSQRLAVDAAISPNDGSLYGNLNLTGPAGSEGSGWTLNV